MTTTNVSTFPVHTHVDTLDDAVRQSAQQYDAAMIAFLNTSLNPDGTVKASSVFRPGTFKWVTYDDISLDIADGWILGDGTIYAVTTYPALAKVYGKKYGGDGTTTFGVPNIADRVIVGYGASATLGTTVGATGGAVNHTHGNGTLAVASHTHPAGTLAAASHAHGAGSFVAADHVHDRGAHQHQLPTATGVGRSGGADTADAGFTDTDGSGNTGGSGTLALSGTSQSVGASVTGDTGGNTASLTGAMAAANQAYLVFKGLIKT